MSNSLINKRDTWNTIGIFLIFLTIFTAIAHYAIVNLNPTSKYVGFLMLSPMFATLVTLKLKGRSIKSLPWQLQNWKFFGLGYLVPVLYISIAYALLWVFGLGDILNTDTLAEWSGELGFEETNTTGTLIVMVLLLAVIGVVKNLGAVFGEELGWRGFFIFELRKVMSFQALAIVSGLIWSAFHWPIIIYYVGGNTLFHISVFTVMILAMSVIMAYYTFKSSSLWPAVIFHSVHNIYIQKIFTPLTISTEKTSLWIDEYGLMLPIVVALVAGYYWRQAHKEKL
jgi:membrane protease YdiL (CAAX protease family)